ncbi:MAG TPA: TIGR01906 family membrane protein [Dehalococcoidia bacterium]|nr:TIGR01906 family membrane protein [Dehalococcoidia bacterium]
MAERMQNRIQYKIFDCLIVLLLPLLFLCTSVRIEMNSPGLYTRGFDLYHVSETTGLDREQLDRIVERLIEYFNSQAVSPQMQVTKTDGTVFPLFHKYELIHLADVKGLFDMNSLLQSISLLVLVTLTAFAASQHRQYALLLSLRNGALLSLAGLVCGAVLFVVDFGGMFVNFHLLLFDNPFWQLDPQMDYLVMLFPFQFWQDMFMFAGAMTGGLSLIVLGISSLSLRPADRFLQHLT